MQQALFLYIYLCLCYFSSSDFVEVTVQCDLFSVLFSTWDMNGILPIRGNLLCFLMLSVVTFIESKLISFTE